jgi:hypothetical protein
MLRYGYLTPAVAFATVTAVAATKGVTNSITMTNASGAIQKNYPYQFGRPFIDGAIADQPRVLINGRPVTTQADVKNRYPDGSVEFAVIAVVIPAIPASGSLTLTFQNQSAGSNTPLTQAQMLAPTYNFDASMALTPVGGTAQAASARTMLQNGDYKLWTSGPVAQTIMLGDDSAARKYDIGFGDGYHPFRPHVYATFWPATHQVYVRAVGENGLTTELEDLNYTLSITSNGTAVYSADLSGKIIGGSTGLSVAVAETASYPGALSVTGTPSTGPVNGTYYVMQDLATLEQIEARLDDGFRVGDYEPRIQWFTGLPVRS